MKYTRYIPHLFLFLFFVGCGQRTTEHSLETCFINNTKTEVSRITIDFSGKIYKIDSLKAAQESCFHMPIYRESSFDVSMCLDGRLVRVPSIGYYYKDSENNQSVNIYLGNKTFDYGFQSSYSGSNLGNLGENYNNIFLGKYYKDIGICER